MKKYLFVVASAVLGFVCTANAQEVELPKYQRSSLHLVLLTTEEPALEGAEDFSAKLDEAWHSYPFPDKYNEHKIDLTVAYGGQPKGSMMEIIKQFSNNLDNLSLAEAKEIMAVITGGKQYEESLVNTVNEIVVNEKVGNQLVRKWFNIQDDGSYDSELIKERAAYNADQAAIAEAEMLSRGTQAILDQGEDLVGNTFVVFSKLSFYSNEPVAAFICNLAKVIASGLPGIAAEAGIVAAEKVYDATKDGYTAKTTSALYQLDWNEEVQAEFYAMFEGDKINMEKFNAYTFPMTLVGIDSANSVTVGNLRAGVEAAATGADVSDVMIKNTIVRNIDKVFAKLQKNYEVFAPVSQIISVNPLVADMGMKEGLEGGEAFNLLEPVYNKQTGKVEWKSIGVVKVSKKPGEIWDNRYSLLDEANGETPAEEPAIKGTILSNNKKAVPGMVVRQVVKAKK